MAGFIIATFRFLVYFVFLAVTLAGMLLGARLAQQQGYEVWFGGALGLLAGFFAAVLVTGIMVILLDIQASLKALAETGRTGSGEVHHHYHHGDDGEGPYPETGET
ncbi:hypothetical protein E5163_01400 [Marinicauda algicola]|uniref:DUF4282 domain-containing protein n=1 Tax=Marinicauda algicola TaxID=2029849 RepID=A0A4S2H2Q7_9PROT|nr:hypothetical protein [Marinicauda algicola]TGY89824.1 hypothetical protein E5163_01400 [Marinicauda algicola]